MATECFHPAIDNKEGQMLLLYIKSYRTCLERVQYSSVQGMDVMQLWSNWKIHTLQCKVCTVCTVSVTTVTLTVHTVHTLHCNYQCCIHYFKICNWLQLQLL